MTDSKTEQDEVNSFRPCHCRDCGEPMFWLHLIVTRESPAYSHAVTSKSLVVTPLEAPSNNAALAPAKSQTHPPQRILLVDDDIAIRQLNSEVLIRSGYRVDTAEDGDAGWRVLDAVRSDPDSYDLLITDNKMPKVSGVELIKKLRSALMPLPVILATSAVPRNTESLQLAAIMEKPFYPDELVQTVKKVLHWSTADANR